MRMSTVHSPQSTVKVRIILAFGFWLLTISSYAQMDKADKLFADYKYAQAIELYKPISD